MTGSATHAERGLPSISTVKPKAASTASARQAIVDYIGWFSGTRLHSTLGYLTPNEFEAATRTEELAKVA